MDLISKCQAAEGLCRGIQSVLNETAGKVCKASKATWNDEVTALVISTLRIINFAFLNGTVLI